MSAFQLMFCCSINSKADIGHSSVVTLEGVERLLPEVPSTGFMVHQFCHVLCYHSGLTYLDLNVTV